MVAYMYIYIILNGIHARKFRLVQFKVVFVLRSIYTLPLHASLDVIHFGLNITLY